ncbi:MAG: sigma factor [Cyanobacteriota bacterium]|nr:sigma factor [Cyanobacteriota bacterium]
MFDRALCSTTATPRLLNQQLLGQLQRCRQPQRRLRLRNRLVLANLGLVHRVAAAQQGKVELSYDDLVSVGSIGLIKAIDSFEPQRGLALSSYAVPFIRGAMQHEERDRNQPLKTPRRLRELQQRVCTLQARRAAQGLPPLGEGGLATALGCRLEQLREARAVQQALRLRSLDAPLAGGDAAEAPLTLLDLVSEAIAC